MRKNNKKNKAFKSTSKKSEPLKPVSNRTVVLGDEPTVVSLAVAAAETDELK